MPLAGEASGDLELTFGLDNGFAKSCMWTDSEETAFWVPTLGYIDFCNNNLELEANFELDVPIF